MSIPRGDKGKFWRSPTGVAFAIFLAVAGFLLVSEHRAHVLGAAPILLILALCVGMHFFMHGGHSGHGGHGLKGDDDVDRKRGDGHGD